MTFDYPAPVAKRSGAKVRWYYYDNEADARKASDLAKAESYEREAKGYDFGFQSPGAILPPGRQSFHPDLWEVCLP